MKKKKEKRRLKSKEEKEFENKRSKFLRKSLFQGLNKIFNKKNRRLVLIFLIIIAAALLFAAFFKINSLIKETLIVNLEPQTLFMSSKNKDSVKISFNVSLTQSLLCRSSCYYSFIDLSKNEMIDEGYIYFKTSGRKSKNYFLKINESGIGKKIYLLEMKCYNDNSTFCSSERSFRYKTSTIVINYELSPKENLSKNRIFEDIENFKSGLYSADFECQKNIFVSKELLSIVPNESFEYKKISESVFVLEQNYEQLLEKISELNHLWASEDYIGAYDKFSKAETIVNFLKDYSSNISEFNMKTLNTLNSVSKKLKTLQEEQKTINNAFKFFQMTDKNKSAECGELFSKTIDHIFYFKNGFYLSLDDFAENVSRIENNISNILKEYHEKSYALNKKLYLDLILANFTLSEFSETNISFNSSFKLNDSESVYALCNETFLLNSMLENRNKKSEDILSSNYSYLKNSSMFLRNAEILKNKSEIEAYKKAKKKFLELNISFEFDEMENLSENQAEFNFSGEMENVSFEELKMISKINFSKGFYENLDFCSMIENVEIKELPTINFILEEKNISFENYTKKAYIDLKENPPRCCFNNSCECCYYNSCNKKYPIIFVHGHLAYEGNSPESSMNSFSRIQMALIKYGYVPFNFDFKSYSQEENFDGFKLTPTIRVSYYFISYYDVGTRIVSVMKQESIENYAIRLKEIIDEAKGETGADKVVIIAHSMGGLVSREYLMLFGDDSVDKLVTIATPHKGISSRTLYFCKLIGSEKECEDMSRDSIFMKRLNSYKPKIKIYNIFGSGCFLDNKDSDGVVYLEDAKLGYGQEYAIKGNCTDVFKTDLHSRLLDPEEYPETFNLILKILED
ncbi:MAG: alpha/beta fold hydrolase [Candidatus Woesearchaeota archaeon]